MYLARGLSVSDVDLCWGGEAAVVVVEGILLQKALARTAADHRPGVEEYYKRMVGWGGILTTLCF